MFVKMLKKIMKYTVKQNSNSYYPQFFFNLFSQTNILTSDHNKKRKVVQNMFKNKFIKYID